MRGGDHSDPGVQFVAWNVSKEKRDQIYFCCELLEISCNFYSTHTTAINCLLSDNVNISAFCFYDITSHSISRMEAPSNTNPKTL